MIEKENLRLVNQEVILESTKVYLEVLEQKKFIELNKLKEEVDELKDAIKNKKNTAHEAADVIYHLLVTLESAGVNFNDIITELKKREGTSGFEEKRNR